MNFTTKYMMRATTLLLLIFSSFLLSAQQGNFPATFYSTAKIDAILSGKDCVGIRFYNVVEPGTENLTTLAIGIKSDGSEIYNVFNPSRKYQVYMGNDRGNPSYDAISKNTAEGLCTTVATMMTSFSASFTRSELQSTYGAGGATGVEVVLTTSGSNDTFQINSASFDGGTINRTPNGQTYTNGEPCPTNCGTASNYINR